MNYDQDPTYVQKDRFLEQIMIEQLHRTHFPSASDWIFGDAKDGENGSVPHLTWTNYIAFINRTSGANIPDDAQIIVTRHPGLPSVIHSHDYFEACYILSGACTNVINNQLEYLKEGDFCLLPPGARHDYEFYPDSLVLYFSIHPTIFSGYCAPLLDGDTAVSHFLLDSLYNGNQEQYLIFHTGDDRSLRLMAIFMFQLMVGSDQTLNPVLGAQLLSFFARMSIYPQIRIQSTPPKAELLDLELLNMIRKNFSTITLADLAKHLHYTVPYCSKYLKEHLGCTFSELVRRMRFQAAEDYLLNSDMSVNQISETLGYENPENFIRAFKKNFRMTPAKYRQTHRRNVNSGGETPEAHS